MACAAAACRSGSCSNGAECDDGSIGLVEGGGSLTSTRSSRGLCFKCKANEAIAGVEGNSTCVGCFRASLYGKFKQAVTSQSMILPTDNVLVALSGGSASRVVLQFVHEMQQKAQRNLDASRDKSYTVFGVGVAFVDENVAFPITSNELDKGIQDMRMIVSNLGPPAKKLHVMPIENICHTKSMDGRNRLKELLDNVTDVTGKEDFLQHLRMLCLQKIASENGYSKLILGSCASKIACHVISATVKGQGYSLPADIQYIDARWEIPAVLPLRDCLAQELSMLCYIDSLKTLDLFNGVTSGVNGLVSSFITLLREENPTRERTIVRTAEKLIPFHFNALLETNDSNDNLPSRARHKRLNLKPGESIASEFLCPICRSPLNKLDVESLRRKLDRCKNISERYGLTCCPSCQFQTLPKEQSSMERFFSLLPQCMITQMKDCITGDHTWLREQIEDCLLSDTEDES